MQVKIGVLNVPTQIVLETDESAEQVKAKVAAALADSSLLELTDSKGAITLVPAAQIGFVELGAEAKRRVGFGLGE